MPKAYFIVAIDVTDMDRFKEYGAQVTEVVAKFGGRYLVRGGAQEIKEGHWPQTRTVVLEFPSLDQANAWYDSPEYENLRALPHAASNGNIVRPHNRPQQYHVTHVHHVVVNVSTGCLSVSSTSPTCGTALSCAMTWCNSTTFNPFPFATERIEPYTDISFCVGIRITCPQGREHHIIGRAASKSSPCTGPAHTMAWYFLV